MAEKGDFVKQIEEVMALAKKNGVAENFFFVATFNDYKRMRVVLARLGKDIDANGTKINGKINPCIAEYNKTAQAAAKIADTLMRMVAGASSGDDTAATEQKKTCPDFEHMDPKSLRKWCKHYDIDPSDYAQAYLIKSLRKRWEFEYGE